MPVWAGLSLLRDSFSRLFVFLFSVRAVGFLFVWIWDPRKLLRSPNLPLTMTMPSLWPWHHSRLWIINRGLDIKAFGLFVGKQGVFLLSRQPGLMACHKLIKRGSVAISSDLLCWPSPKSFALTFGLFSLCWTAPAKSSGQVSESANGFMHSSRGVCYWPRRTGMGLLTSHTNNSHLQ